VNNTGQHKNLINIQGRNKSVAQTRTSQLTDSVDATERNRIRRIREQEAVSGSNIYHQNIHSVRYLLTFWPYLQAIIH